MALTVFLAIALISLFVLSVFAASWVTALVLYAVIEHLEDEDRVRVDVTDMSREGW